MYVPKRKFFLERKKKEKEREEKEEGGKGKKENTCVLSCSEQSLKVVVIFLERLFAFTKPYENNDISAIRA